MWYFYSLLLIPVFVFLLLLKQYLSQLISDWLYADFWFDTEQENKTKTVIKFTDYKELKGVELIKMVQLVLKDSGFDPGPIDGVFGPKTRAATKQFQEQNNLEPTGKLDKYTLDRLFWSF